MKTQVLYNKVKRTSEFQFWVPRENLNLHFVQHSVFMQNIVGTNDESNIIILAILSTLPPEWWYNLIIFSFVTRFSTHKILCESVLPDEFKIHTHLFYIWQSALEGCVSFVHPSTRNDAMMSN